MLIIATVLIFTGAGTGLAHDGWGGRGSMMGYGGHMMGNGGHMRGYGGQMMGPGYGSCYGDLSKEDYSKLEAAREKFFDQTRDLRRELDEKRDAMEDELAKETPDRDKINALQDDISKLRSEWDRKALEHRLEVREMMPESARGRAYAGGYRGGNCW
jgi:Spy/CpxP family protein refolding chaperone